MLTIKLPDGSEKHFEKPTNGIEIAESIGENLAKAAVAIEIDGKQRDLSDEISNDAMVSIITLKSDAGLEIMRHTLTAQVLARAVKNLYPNSKLAIGPTVTDGFYYDFEIDKQLSIDDLPKIEEEMKKIIVFGGGQVGSSVAKILSDDGNDITLVDYDKDVLSDLREKMDIKTIHGLASYPSVQKLADAENSDMIIAVTGSDEVNMAACHVAKSIYNVPKRIARLRAKEYLRDEDDFDKSAFSIADIFISFLSSKADDPRYVFIVLSLSGVINTKHSPLLLLSSLEMNVSTPDLLRHSIKFFPDSSSETFPEKQTLSLY